MAILRKNKVAMLIGLALLALLITIGMGSRGALAGAPLVTPAGGKAALGASGKVAPGAKTASRTARLNPASVTNPSQQAVNSSMSQVPIEIHDIDLGRLGIHPTDRPMKLLTPDGNAVGTQNAFMSVSPEVVSQTTTGAIGTLISSYTPAESVQYFINGALAGTFTADATGRLAISISTGAGFGYLTFQTLGVTSGKVAGGVAQVLDAAPPVPGLAIAPHAVNHSITGVMTTTLYMFGVRWQTGGTPITLARDGTSLGNITTTTGRFVVQITVPVTTTDLSAIYTAVTATNQSLAGQSVEERSDAGTHPQGDQNLARAYVDRPIVPTAGGVVVFSGEGFQANEPVTLGTCTAPVVASADANGAIAFFLDTTGAPAGNYKCSYTGNTSGRVARGTIQVNASARNAPTGINSPATLPSGSADFVFLFDRMLPNQGGSIYIDGTFVMTSTTAPDGTGGEVLPAPTTQGIHEVAFIDDAGEIAIAPLFIGPPAVLTPTPTGTLPTSTPTLTPTFTNTPTFTPTPVCPGSWTAQAVYPINIFDHGAAAQGSFLYSFGGSDGTVPIATSYKYDSGSNTWSPIASLPGARQKAGVVSDGTNLYIIGGVAAGSALTTTLWSYDPGTDTYNTSLASFTTPAWAPAVAYLNGKIYKMGGCADGTCAASITTVEVYDIASNTWSTAAPLPAAIGWATAIGFNGKVYFAGGTVPADTNKTFAYDPGTNTWDDAAIADLPVARWNGTSGIVNGKWMIAGGVVGGNVDGTSIQWDPNTNTWAPHDPMLQPRYRGAGGVINNALYVVGGSITPFVGTNNNQRFFDLCAVPTSTPTATATNTPAIQIIGHVTYQGIAQPQARNIQAITLTLCIGGVGQNFVQNTDSQGFFTVTLGTGPGNYNYRVKSYKNLAKAGTLPLANGTNNVEFGTLNTGDSDNNNLINTTDFTRLRNAFGTASNPFTDFNNDGITNTTDFTLMRNNFGTAGQNLTCP